MRSLSMALRVLRIYPSAVDETASLTTELWFLDQRERVIGRGSRFRSSPAVPGRTSAAFQQDVTALAQGIAREGTTAVGRLLPRDGDCRPSRRPRAPTRARYLVQNQKQRRHSFTEPRRAALAGRAPNGCDRTPSMRSAFSLRRQASAGRGERCLRRIRRPRPAGPASPGCSRPCDGARRARPAPRRLDGDRERSSRDARAPRSPPGSATGRTRPRSWCRHRPMCVSSGRGPRPAKRSVPLGGPYTRPMGRTRSSRQCLQQAASGMRPAAGIPTVVDPADAALAAAPETRRTALHGHG